MSLVAVNNIRKEYRNKIVLANVSMQVEKGERVALVGPNGAGKTTLLKIMMGQEVQDEGEVFLSKKIKVGYLSQYLTDLDETKENALHFDELEKLETKKTTLEDKMATMPNNIEELLIQYEKIIEAFDQMDGYTLQNKIKKTLLGLGLSKEDLYKPLKVLSGGEKMRVALARILIDSPELLILDEPTNHLDLHAIEWLESFLKKFKGGVLIVSHDRYFLDSVTTRITELRGGHLTTKKCNYSSYIEQKRLLREYYLKEQTNIKKQIKHQNEMIMKLRKYKKIKQSQSREKALIKFEEKAQEIMLHLRSSENLDKANGPNVSFQSFSHLSHEVMHCENLSKSFGDKALFKNLNLTIYGGEKIAIIGANGCGKTTFINMMLGKDKNFEGSMTFGKWVDYAYLGQEVSFDDDNLSLIEIMLKEDIDMTEAKKRLGQFQFYGDNLNTKIENLSGGEKVRLSLALILLKAPHCLILDEPTNHLDLESRISIEKALNNYKGTVIAISHDRYFLNACITRIISVEALNVVEYEGLYDDFKLRQLVKPKSKESQMNTLKYLKKSIENIEAIPAGMMTDKDYETYDQLMIKLDEFKEK